MRVNYDVFMILCYKSLMLKGGSFHHDLQSQIFDV